MSLTPEEIEAAQFTLVRRGYAPDEVAGLLRRIADHLRSSDDYRTAGDEVATALRGLHGLLSGMKEETEQEMAVARAEAEAEAARVKDEAEQFAARTKEEAALEVARLRREAEDEINRKRTDADREMRALLEEAEADTTRLLELAEAEKAAADREAEAVRQTVRAKRDEIDGYVRSASERAERSARERVARVLEQHKEDLDRLLRSRQEVARDMERLQSILRSTLDEAGRYVDLTQPKDNDQNGSHDEGHGSSLDELARNIVNEVLSEERRPPTAF
jgi:DivIVA domain-containing protein